MRTPPPSHRRLARVPGLESADRRTLEQIDSLMDEFSLSAGRVLIDEGRSSRQVILVARGSVEERSGGHLVTRHGPGDLVGLWSARRGLRSPSEAVTASDVDVFVVDARDVDALLEAAPIVPIAERSEGRFRRWVEQPAARPSIARHSKKVTGELGATR